MELQLHNERLARHCAGVLEALNKEKAAFHQLQEGQSILGKNFRKRIQDMESIFLKESRAEVSVGCPSVTRAFPDPGGTGLSQEL